MTAPEVKTESENYYGNGQICRLCMSEESLDDVFNDKHLKEWIREFLAIKISRDDGMSQVICNICRLRLTEFHQFRMGCQEVQEVLQAMILDGTNGAHSAQTAPVQMDCAAFTSKTESGVSSCRIRSESNCANLDSQEGALCVGSFSKVESPTHFQDKQMENNSLDIEDCIDVGEFKVETRSDDKVTVGTKKRKKATDVCVNENSSTVFLKRGNDKPSRRKTVNYSSHPERSGSESNESDFDAKVSESDYADEVEQHSTSKNCEEVYKCSKCDQTFNRDCRLKTHMAMHEEKENDESSHDSSCEDDETFDKSDKAVASDEKQETQIDSEEVYQCDLCPKLYSNSRKLTNHQRYHIKKLGHQAANATNKKKNQKTRKTSTQCDVCQKNYINRKTMLAHKRNVHGPKKHRCDICNLRFIVREHMQKHLYTRRHMDKVQQMQRLKDEESPNKTGAKQKKNMKEKKTMDPNLLHADLFAKYQTKNMISWNKKYECNLCDKIFSNRWAYNNHNSAKHGPRKVECEICGFKFTTKEKLRTHLQQHESRGHTSPPGH